MNPKVRTIPVSLILGSSLVIALFWAYWPVMKSLAAQLLGSEDYSFGLLLPLVGGYIVYLKWPHIKSRSLHPAWTGVVVLFLGLTLYILGQASTDLYIPRLSFVLSLCGVFVILGGWQLALFLWFPLFLLIFMIPLPQFLFQKLTLPLQLISSRLATGMLQIIGIPAVRQGNVIDLGVRQLQVVAACSGLRYILSLLALGFIFCYFYQRRPWKVAILILSLIPAAIIANALRVAGMGIFPALQVGFWHSFSGWLIFIFCLGFLFLLNRIISNSQDSISEDFGQDPPRAVFESVNRDRPSYFPHLLVALVMVLGAGYFALYVAKVAPVPLLQSFDSFPMQLGPWQGRQTRIDPVMVEATKANAYLNAEFTNPGQGSVSLWIAYYENQKGGGSVHSPFSCLTGSGWNLLESGITDIAPGLPVRYMVMEQGGGRYLIYYWYLQRGRWLTSEYLNKLYLSYDGLISRRADGALVRLITAIMPDSRTAQTKLDSFARLLVPKLPQFIKE